MAALSQFTSVQIQLLCLGTLLRSDHSQSLPLLAAGKHTNTRSMDWKNSENSKGDVLHPELPLLFCKVKAKGNVSNSPKGNDSKNNPDDLLYLASFMFTTKQRGQSRVHQTHNPMQGTQHEPCWPGSSCCICRVLLRFKWGDLAENVYDDHMPPTYCFSGAQPPPHQRT